MNTYTNMHAHIYTYTHVNTYTHMHTYTYVFIAIFLVLYIEMSQQFKALTGIAELHDIKELERRLSY